MYSATYHKLSIILDAGYPVGSKHTWSLPLIREGGQSMKKIKECIMMNG